MNILFFTNNLASVGGIQEYNKNFLKALKQLHHRTTNIQLKRGFLSKIFFIIEGVISVAVLKQNFIICGHINFSPFCLFLKKVFGKKYILITHGIDVWDVERDIYKKGLIGAVAVITVSSFTKWKIIEQFPEVADRVIIIPNTIDEKKFYPKEKNKKLLEKYGISKDKIILTVARLSVEEQYKGYDQVIRAIPLVIQEFPNIKYILVGGGNDIIRVKELIHELGLQKYIITPGYVSEDELVDYYNICDVFVMPSKGEGFGIVFLEALACGKSVIAGNKDGSRGALLDGKLGLLVDPENVESISDAILKVFKKEICPDLINQKFLRNVTVDTFGLKVFREKIDGLLVTIGK